MLFTPFQQRYLQWFRREPEEHRRRDTAFLMHIFEDVKKRMANGACSDCLASQTMANMEQTGMSDVEIAYALSTPFGAGIETVALPKLSEVSDYNLQTAGTMLSFIRKYGRYMNDASIYLVNSRHVAFS